MADLFCGAGGTSTGAMEAIEAMGMRPSLTAINHWPTAIRTHSVNHPDARHLCTGIDEVDPAVLYKDLKLTLLWASPECTHFSLARGGMPVNKQSRATAWCVVRWARKVSPPVFCVENVPEFRTWGPVRQRRGKGGLRCWQVQKKTKKGKVAYKDVAAPFGQRKGEPLKCYHARLAEVNVFPSLEPDPRAKGETFNRWLRALRKLGYKVSTKIMCAADFGDPTTRRRLFVQGVKISEGRGPCWPNPTHADPNVEGKIPSGLRPWVPARAIIDWSLPGKSIFERDKPLSPKTIARIEAGLMKFGLRPFLANACHGNSGKKNSAQWNVHSLQKPIGGITTTSERGLVQSFLVRYQGDHDGRDESSRRAQSLDNPLTTLTTENRFGLVEASIKKVDGRVVAPCEGFILSAGGPDCPARPDSEPMGTILTRDHRALAMPELIKINPADENETPCGAFILPQQSMSIARPDDAPVPTIATSGGVAFVQPFLLKYFGTGGARTVESPIDTLTTKPHYGLVRPIVVVNGERYFLDIRFRMLQPHELSLAQGFPKDYRFAGTKSETVKMIGNAVPRHLARAIALAALTGDSNVAPLLEAFEQTERN